MKKQIFAVCDPEADYARNFMDYLNRKKNLPFEIQAFTSVQSLVRYAGDHHIELLLISSEAMCPEIRELDTGKTVILTEGSKRTELDSYDGVYKYQASSDIVREVMAYYGEEKAVPDTESPVLKKTTEILGIYSPLGRCGKTSFALTLGQLLGKERPTLYINMEEYSGFEERLRQKYPFTLSDLLYYIKEGEQNIAARINSMVRSIQELDYIPPVQSPGDIRGAMWQDWEKLLSEIVLHTSYETVVLDIGNGIDEVFQMLDQCARVYMPVHTDPVSESKLRQYENIIKLRDYPQLLTKTVRIKLPACQAPPAGPGWAERLLWSELGDYTRELIRKERL